MKAKQYTDTEKYIITDGEYYIYKNAQGKFVQIRNESWADRFSKSLATKILNNSLPKGYRRRYKVKCISPEEEIEGFKAVPKDAVTDNCKKILDDKNIQNWVSKIESLNGLSTEAQNRNKELVQQLSQVDRELSVLDHYIESMKFNACQGYKIMRVRQTKRIARREIKNELVVLSYILSNKIGHVAGDEIQKVVNGLSDRKYDPKAFQELFDF